MEEARENDISYAQLFFIMMYSIMLMYLPWMSEHRGKGKEIKRDRKPFDEKIGPKLSNYQFRRVYALLFYLYACRARLQLLSHPYFCIV